VESDRAGGAEAGGFGVGRSKIEERLDSETGGGEASLRGGVDGVEFAGTETDTALGSVVPWLVGVETSGACVTVVGKGGGVGCILCFVVGLIVGLVGLLAPAGSVGAWVAPGEGGLLERTAGSEEGEGDSAFFEVNFAV
jgi:hypothetical protein